MKWLIAIIAVIYFGGFILINVHDASQQVKRAQQKFLIPRRPELHLVKGGKGDTNGPNNQY